MAWDLNNYLNQSRIHLNYRRGIKKLKKLTTPAGGILLLMGIVAGSAFTDVLIRYMTTTKEVPVSEPTIMLFLGSGLIGLAGVIRKRFFKKEILTNNGDVNEGFPD